MQFVQFLLLALLQFKELRNYTWFQLQYKNQLRVCLEKIKKPAYFTSRLIFATIYGSTALFDTIHGSHDAILANFYFYLQYFQ